MKSHKFDCRINQWGQAVYLSHYKNSDGSIPVAGCLTPLPKKGDFVFLADGNTYEFTEVIPWNNPPDGFEGILKITEKMDGDVPQPEVKP